MNKSRIALIIAGSINLLTALIHTFLGELDLIIPLKNSELSRQVVTELTGVWHITTILLFATTFILLQKGFSSIRQGGYGTLKQIALLYLLFSLSFIAVSLFNGVFAPQWVLLLPIALFTFLGVKFDHQKESL
ncbi:MAG: hypothetical protein N4A35_16110 [Flavobacteriales bacterium]|jgi:hypothetical protein|nr:hypothetical protein [Flavobacteriales bacterium]